MRADDVRDKVRGGKTCFAARQELRSSRRASSAALAVSMASDSLCLASNWAFCTICRLVVLDRPGRLPVSELASQMSFITPVDSHRGAGKGYLPMVESTAYWPSLGIALEEDEEASRATLSVLVLPLGVPVGVETSRRPPNDARG